jgi:hypothetical protein
MTLRTPAELRASAAHLREMASEGGDPQLQDALLLVADELDREAVKSEKGTSGEGEAPP